MRSHPMSEKADQDRMSELEVRMADATNLAGVEKIPQVGFQETIIQCQRFVKFVK